MAASLVRFVAALSFANRIALTGFAIALVGVIPGCSDDTQSEDDSDGNDGQGNSPNNNVGGSSNGPGNGGSSSSGPTEPDCSGDELTCLDNSTVGVCEGGEFTPYDCTEGCDYLGFDSNGCSSDNCQCGDPNDEQCLDGVGAFCACLEYFEAGTCTDADYANMYGGCHEGDPDFDTVSCFGNYVSGGQVDCDAAANACL